MFHVEQKAKMHGGQPHTMADKPTVSISATTEMIVSHTDQVLIVSATFVVA